MPSVRLILRALLINIAGWMVLLLALSLLYFAWLRDWQMHWGATAEDVSRSMAGDELLAAPHLNATRAVVIDAPPEDVWPWLVQMGYKRAGLYSFDRLDNAGLPSADRILPEYQGLAVGDSISLGGPSLRVAAMEPGRAMLWVFTEGSGPWENATWSWGLYETDRGTTRLVSRLRHRYTFDSLQATLMWSMMDATEIMMMRASLLGIKRRVEASKRSLS
jgi:hypothetical protein